MKHIEKRPKKESRFSITIINPIRRQIFDDKGILFSWRVEKKGGKYPSFQPSRFKLKIYRLDTKGRLKEKNPVVEKILTGQNIRLDNEIFPSAKGDFFGVSIEALSASSEILAESPLRRFGRYSRTAPEHFPGPAAEAPKLRDFLPHSPVVWGKPVTLRHPSFYTPIPVEHDDTPLEGGSGGTVEPKVWGSPAAYLELPAEFIANCNIRWDYSHIDGGQAVALQIAGDEGFAYMPGEEENHLEDPNAVATFWGPLTTCQGEDETEGAPLFHSYSFASDQPVFGYLPWLDLFSEEIWGEAVDVNEPLNIHLRLIPVGPLGVSLGADYISPHTLIHYSGAPNVIRFHGDPGNNNATTTTTWRWGTVPEREIQFRLFAFDCGFDQVSAPCTLLITTDIEDAPPADWVNHSELYLRSGSSSEWEQITATTIATSNFFPHNRLGCYVIDVAWGVPFACDCRLIEYWPRHPDTSNGIPLLPHLTPTVQVIAYPGIVSDDVFCGGPFTRDSVDLPDVPFIDRDVCNQLEDTSVGLLDFSGWNELYRFFTGTFTGQRIAVTRRVERRSLSSDIDEILDWENWEEEESTESTEDLLVSVDFSISGAPLDGEDLMQLMARTGNVLMECIERGVDLADYSMTYTFEWRGLWGTLTEEDGALRHFGGLHGPYGTVMLGLPDRLEMDFSVELDRSRVMEGGFIVSAVKHYLDLSYRLNRV